VPKTGDRLGETPAVYCVAGFCSGKPQSSGGAAYGAGREAVDDIGAIEAEAAMKKTRPVHYKELRLSATGTIDSHSMLACAGILAGDALHDGRHGIDHEAGKIRRERRGRQA